MQLVRIVFLLGIKSGRKQAFLVQKENGEHPYVNKFYVKTKHKLGLALNRRVKCYVHSFPETSAQRALQNRE